MFNTDDYMNQFEKVVVYYDNGQEALGAIIDTLLMNKNNVEHRIEFDHKVKRLFQVSDMLTFIDKIVYKHNNITLNNNGYAPFKNVILSTMKIYSELGWIPKYTIEEGFTRSLKHFENIL